jgi:hypothetical protein
MKKLIAALLALSLLGMTPAGAHQPVVLLNSDTTPSAGPLLVDGTVSFAFAHHLPSLGRRRLFALSLKRAIS